jgi:hypothetical protein
MALARPGYPFMAADGVPSFMDARHKAGHAIKR